MTMVPIQRKQIFDGMGCDVVWTNMCGLNPELLQFDRYTLDFVLVKKQK